MPDAYMYLPARPQWKAKKYGGMAHPPLVQFKDKVYFFVKKETPADEEIFVDAKEYFSRINNVEL